MELYNIPRHNLISVSRWISLNVAVIREQKNGSLNQKPACQTKLTSTWLSFQSHMILLNTSQPQYQLYYLSFIIFHKQPLFYNSILIVHFTIKSSSFKFIFKHHYTKKLSKKKLVILL